MTLDPVQLNKLPARMRQRLTAIDDDTDVALAIARAATDKVGDARTAWQNARTDKQRLSAVRLPIFDDRADKDQSRGTVTAVKSRRDIDSKDARETETKQIFDRVQDNADSTHEIWTAKGQTRQAVETYVLFALRNGGLVDAETPAKITAEHADDDRQVALEELSSVRRSTLPLAEIKAAARTILAQRALPLQLSVNDLLKTNVRPPLLGAGGVDGFALLAFYMPDVLLADLDAQAERLVAGRLQLSLPDRRDALAAAHAKLLDAEMVLAELVWARFAKTGHDLVFPAGLDPRAVLGVIGPVPPAP